MPARKKGEGSVMNAGFLLPTGLQAMGRKMQGREEKDEGEGRVCLLWETGRRGAELAMKKKKGSPEPTRPQLHRISSVNILKSLTQNPYTGNLGYNISELKSFRGLGLGRRGGNLQD